MHVAHVVNRTVDICQNWDVN